MRVIAGSAGGIGLGTPRTDLRPTMDQVRAAIFSSLAEQVNGARVLDLFAGTGAMGIEALSRGAREAVFVENDRRAVACIEANLAKTKLAQAGRIVCAEAFSFIERAAGQEPFGLIFADPPYTKGARTSDFSSRLLGSDALPRCLAVDGVFVLERSPRKELPQTVKSRWTVIRQRRYGSTEVVFLRRERGGIAQDSEMRVGG